MPEYQVRITRTAQKQLDKIPSQIAIRLFDLIQSLDTDPRIIYDVFDKLLIVEVIAVGDRKDIYH